MIIKREFARIYCHRLIIEIILKFIPRSIRTGSGLCDYFVTFGVHINTMQTNRISDNKM